MTRPVSVRGNDSFFVFAAGRDRGEETQDENRSVPSDVVMCGAGSLRSRRGGGRAGRPREEVVQSVGTTMDDVS